MSNLVMSLRQYADSMGMDWSWLHEAADEIERLQEQTQTRDRNYNELWHRYCDRGEEIERLRTALERIWNEYPYEDGAEISREALKDGLD